MYTPGTAGVQHGVIERGRNFYVWFRPEAEVFDSTPRNMLFAVRVCGQQMLRWKTAQLLPRTAAAPGAGVSKQLKAEALKAEAANIAKTSCSA